MSKIREKESLECGRMHIWALKTQKLPGPLSGPWTPTTNCSLRYIGNFQPQHLGPPLDQILDPHLILQLHKSAVLTDFVHFCVLFTYVSDITQIFTMNRFYALFILQIKHSHVYISLVFVWLVGPVEKFCLNWFPSGVVDGTCHVCKYSACLFLLILLE